MFGRCDKIGGKLLSVINVLIYFFVFFALTVIVFVRCCFGKFELLELPVLLLNGVTKGISFEVLLLSGIVIFVVPLLLCWLVFYIFKHFYKDIKRTLPLWVLLVYAFLLFGLGLFTCKGYLDKEDILNLYYIFVLLCLLVVNRDFRKCNQLFVGVLFLIGLGGYVYCNENFIAPHYEDYFVEDTRSLKMDKKRNVIVIFAESFENRFSEIKEGDKVFKVKDEDAIRFSNFVEGKDQGITISALSAFLNGASYLYGKDYKKYFASKKALESLKNKEEQIDLKNIGVGNVLKHNGYVNLFIKGADIDFMNTDIVLMRNGFLRENIYDQESFLWWKDYVEENKVNWWGPSDKDVMEKFKEKILSVEKGKPFFAVMFTCDLHARMGNLYKNPFFDSDEEIIKSTINNINDFIDWFKKQEWYQNTTLIVLADHRKMGNPKREKKERLYNAFFNVPEELKKDLRVERKFNQVDMAPTLLEIAGVKLKKRRYGVGVSLFSKYETIAEKEL